MEQSPQDRFEEYGRLSAALQPYCDRITHKIYGRHAKQELTETEHNFDRLYYYWAAALVNAGDVFGYVHFIIENKAAFITIGADGTLAALEKLLPFYQEQQELKDDNERGAYWWKTKEERASAEARAEGVNQFARLLLAFAEKNLPLHNERKHRGQ